MFFYIDWNAAKRNEVCNACLLPQRKIQKVESLVSTKNSLLFSILMKLSETFENGPIALADG